MPLRDFRARMLTAVTGRRVTSGKYHVDYRDATGKTLAATVMSAGSVSGLKLNIDNAGGLTRIVDNVPAATTLKQTGVYWLRE